MKLKASFRKGLAFSFSLRPCITAIGHCSYHGHGSRQLRIPLFTGAGIGMDRGARYVHTDSLCSSHFEKPGTPGPITNSS